MFKFFHKVVERQLETKLKTMQIDLVGSIEVLPYFQEHRIEYRMFCLYKHQQHGRVKCEHRYIVQISLVLLSQACMPLKF